MVIKHQNTKTLKTRDNGRSSDAVAPNFIYGCLGGCMSSYCYVGRYNHDKVYVNDNLDDILSSISAWVNEQRWPKVANQTDDTYYTIDIGCSTDVALMTKFYDWQKVFDYFNEFHKVKSTFATKYPSRFPDKYYLKKGKHRIRVSLMPQKYADILEPNTDPIWLRIDQIARLQAMNLEVHINFSPIIHAEGWLDEYRSLFQMLKDKAIDTKCECIFLTYNDRQYERNSEIVNSLCWRPDIQEYKNSNYADNNIRYKWEIKANFIDEFKDVYKKFFNLQNIRYIF